MASTTPPIAAPHTLPEGTRTNHNLFFYGPERSALVLLSSHVASQGRAVTVSDLIRAAVRTAKANPEFLKAYDMVRTEKFVSRAETRQSRADMRQQAQQPAQRRR
jgi:hypothetical protein